MIDVENRIQELVLKIQLLQNSQQKMNEEISQLHDELLELRIAVNIKPHLVEHVKQAEAIKPVREVAKPIAPVPDYSAAAEQQKQPAHSQNKYTNNQKLEDFIGTNLISKVGILITIIGIFIGAKYAIDKELISPAMRIVLGYGAGAALVLTALKLKSKYENFSAVLMGGGLSVFYFITYVSYSFYQLFPQTLAFLLMVVITGAAVSIALWYNQKIIAILGQVAAYAIPFLLSDGSGRVLILFSYISVINIGLLALSFRKNWKVLYRIAFVLTWSIYMSWVVIAEPEVQHFSTGLIFLSINFIIFYVTFLSYKVLRKEQYNLGEVLMLLLNALVFFFLGTGLINDSFKSDHVLTYFTIANAIIHLVVGFIMYRLKLADHSVYQFLLGLGFLFITIAIPIELNGSWVTLLWTVEATVLCWIGFKNNRSLYLVIAAPMIIVAAISLIQDWALFYPYILDDITSTVSPLKQPFLHVTFWFSLFVTACFGYITRQYFVSKPETGPFVASFFRKWTPVIFLSTLYFTFCNEIHHSWDYVINKTPAVERGNLINFQKISWMIFSLLYVALILDYSRRFIKATSHVPTLLLLGLVFTTIFLLSGFYTVGELRDAYIASTTKGIATSSWFLLVRYIGIVSLAILFIAAWFSMKKLNKPTIGVRGFAVVLNITLLAVICNEFVHWMDISGYQNQYKLGLSIICAVYALALVFIGITFHRKDLRIEAIVLFALTLLKLFFYDLSALSTISKTIVLVILGIILLVVSFLYNKYKDVILGESKSS